MKSCTLTLSLFLAQFPLYPYKDDHHQDKNRSTSIFSSRPTNLHQFDYLICDEEEEINDNGRGGAEQVVK